MSHKYKIKELVTNVTDVGTFTDPYLCGPTSIVVDPEKTVWIACNGDGQSINRSVCHYDLYGVRRSDNLPFIDYVSPTPLVPPSSQRLTISDLFWLQKNVAYYRDGIVVPMPKFYIVPPIVGTPAKQPSLAELALDKFMNKPNGYLGSTVDISYLINYCINKPAPLTSASGKKAAEAMDYAHKQIYPKLTIDLFNKDLINQYGAKLSEAQRWLASGAYNVGPSITPRNDDVIQLFDHSNDPNFPKIETVQNDVNNQLPIGLVYNNSRGFVGYQFNGARVSCDLIAATPKGVIYVYSPLIQTGVYYGFVTVVDNRDSYSVYTGITMSENNIYVTDLSNRRIEVLNFGWATNRDVEFIDLTIPGDYSPYNIYAYKDEIIVLYAKINLTSSPYLDKVEFGAGFGIINVFTLNGVLKKRAVTFGDLNAPWGITRVKHHFIKGGKWIISNHGDGRILIYDSNWVLVEKLHYSNYEKALAGLYGVCSINESLYFTSGANGIVYGIYGEIKKEPHHHHHHHSPSPCRPCRPCRPCNPGQTGMLTYNGSRKKQIKRKK